MTAAMRPRRIVSSGPCRSTSGLRQPDKNTTRGLERKAADVRKGRERRWGGMLALAAALCWECLALPELRPSPTSCSSWALQASETASLGER